MSILTEKKAEEIVGETVAEYARKTGETPGEANPERIIMDVMAYRELLLRLYIKRVADQNFVKTATGSYLNKWGDLFGVPRNKDESDDSYRSRINQAAQFKVVGTKHAYYSKITNMADVADVYIETKREDSTLPPGIIRLYLLQRFKRQNESNYGKKHLEEMEATVNRTILTDDFGIIGEQFLFASATPANINGSIALQLVSGTTKQTAIDAVNDVVEAYIDEISLKLQGVFDKQELERRVRKVSGVRDNSTLTFINVPNLDKSHYIAKGTITVTAS